MMPALEQHKAKLLLAAASGRLPDVASIDSFWLPLFLEGGHLQPLNEYWPAEDRADFLPFTTETLSDRSGNIYGLWHETDCRALFYRKDLVAEPPKTWDALIATASRIARERRIAGYLYNAGRWEAHRLRSPADVLGAGRRAGRRRRPSGVRPAAASRSAGARAVVPAARRCRAARRRARCSPATTTSSCRPRRSPATSRCSSAATGRSASSRTRCRRKSSPSGASRRFRSSARVRRPPAPAAGSGWCSRAIRRSGGRRRSSSSTSKRRANARADQRGHGPAAGAPQRLSRLRRVPPGAVRVLRRDAWRGSRAPGGADLQRDLARAADRHRLRHRRHAHAGRGGGRGVSDRRRTRTRGGARACPPRQASIRSLWIAGHRRGASWRLCDLRGARPRHSYVAGAGGRPGRGVSALPDSRAGAHRLHRSRRAGRTVSLHAARVPRARRRSAVPRHDWRHAGVRRAPRWRCSLASACCMAWLFDAAERRRVAGSLTARVAVVSAWVIPGVLIGVIWKILLIENRSGIVNYWLSHGRPGAGAAAVVGHARAGVGDRRQHVARHGVQHADAVRRASPHPARAARSRRPRRPERRGSGCAG